MRYTQALLPLTALVCCSEAFWRLPCRGRSGLGLIDPIVDSGRVSSHSHTIQGPSNFGLSANGSSMMQSNCTSCGVQQDLSAYWTPPLYFMYPNGTSVMLEQEGGMLAYYLQYGDDLVEFPQGFQMIAGDATRRNFTCQTPEPPKSQWSGYEVSQDALSQKALGFNCLNYAAAAEPSLGRHFLPNKTFIDQSCPDGLRLELFFPSCWNGVDEDSPDHKSHMAYPSLINGGDCPPGYPKRTASLLFETIWNTAAFNSTEGQFVLSTGDPTGFSYHGDFMAGWQKGFLQQAINQCTDASGEVSACSLFDLNTDDQMGQCTFPNPPQLANSDCEGPIQGLPGGVQIQSGPAPAPFPSSPATSQAGASSAAPSSAPSASAPVPSSQASSSAPVSSPQPVPSSVMQSASGAISYPASTSGDLVIAAAASTGAPTANYQASSSAAAPAAPSSISSSAAAPVVPSSAPTSAPSAPTAATSPCVSTTTMYEGGTQLDVCIVDTVTTVTATAEASAQPYKRHLHEHKLHRRNAHAGHF